MTIDEIRSLNRWVGGKFFENAYGTFFRSVVVGEVLEGAGGIFFITKDTDESDTPASVRYRLWQVKADGHIGLAPMDAEADCDWMPYTSVEAASERAKVLAKGGKAV